MDEMIKHYEELHTKMSHSTNVEDMILFGDVMHDLFCKMAELNPDYATKSLEKLEAINWCQYLTKDEAVKIVSCMTPSPKWDYPTLMGALKKLELPCEEMGIYNSYALWVVMSQQYSDIGENIAWAIGLELSTIDETKLAVILYKIALKYLKDQDGVYDVRQYFKSILKENK